MKTVTIQAGGVIVKVRDKDKDYKPDAKENKKTQPKNIPQENESK